MIRQADALTHLQIPVDAYFLQAGWNRNMCTPCPDWKACVGQQHKSIARLREEDFVRSSLRLARVSRGP